MTSSTSGKSDRAAPKRQLELFREQDSQFVVARQIDFESSEILQFQNRILVLL